MSLNKNSIRKGILLGITSASLFTGCTPAIPEGDIKDFVVKLNYEEAYKNTMYGESVIEVEHIEDNKVAGTIEIITRIDHEIGYYYLETNVTGNYFGELEEQYDFYSQKKLIYKNNDDIVAYQLTDGIYDEITCDEETLQRYIEDFFYIEVEAGYHQGGSYYGDYVAANCGRYYPRFSINETKDILSYDITTSSIDIDNFEIISMQNFSINEFGMLLQLSLSTFYVKLPNKVNTTIQCDYSGNFERLKTL